MIMPKDRGEYEKKEKNKKRSTSTKTDTIQLTMKNPVDYVVQQISKFTREKKNNGISIKPNCKQNPFPHRILGSNNEKKK